MADLTTQGLLSSIAPWMNGANPSALDNSFAQYGGFQGMLDAMLQAGGPDTSAARMGAALERSRGLALQDALARQQLAQGNVKTAQSAMMLPILQQYYAAAAGSQPRNASAAPNASNATPGGFNAAGAQSGPSAQPGVAPSSGGFSITSPPPSASPFTVPTPDQIASMPVGGMSPQMLRLGGLISGQGPLAIAQQIRQQQMALAQQQYGPVLAQLDTLGKAQSPTQYVKADPRLMAQWRQMAPTLGYDPVQGFTDPNVRTAFSFLRNRIAGALTLPTVAPPVQQSQVAGPLNSLYSRNPITNALTQVRPEESLKPVVGPNGRVSYVPASQAAGRTPFNAETYINPQTTDGVAQLIASYRYPADKLAYAMRTPQGQAIMAAVQRLNPGFDASTYAVKQQAREKFATGRQGDIVRSLSVATNHLDQLSQAADALAQNDFPTFNRLVNAIGVHITGANPVTNFNAMKEIVGDEVVKAVVGSSGAEGDRQAIKDAFDAARSPDQIQGVIQKYEGLMGGQLAGLQRQYNKATGLNDFDSFVSQQAEQQLNPAGASISDAALLKKWGAQ